MAKDTLSLPKQIENELLAELYESDPGERFPSESDLAKRFNVSRVTVREALSSLERKGILVRKQGVGTFVNRHVLKIQARIDESIEFGELIRDTGHEATLSEAQVSIAPAEAEVAGRLQIEAGEETLVFRKVFAADGVPVIYVVNVVPLKLVDPRLRNLGFEDTLKAETIYNFLTRHCHQTVAYQIADLKAVVADEEIGRYLFAFGVKPVARGVPILNIVEVGYNAEDQPLFYSDEYYNTDVIQFNLLRKPG